MAAFTPFGALPIAGAGEAVLAETTAVGREFFAVMGVGAARGRLFALDEMQPGGACSARRLSLPPPNPDARPRGPKLEVGRQKSEVKALTSNFCLPTSNFLAPVPG